MSRRMPVSNTWRSIDFSGEARTAGYHEHGAHALAIAELPDGSLDPQQRARAEGTHTRGGPEQPLAESSTVDPPHVQLQSLTVVRRAGDGEAAAPAVLQQ